MANIVATNIAGISNDFETGDLSALATYTAGPQSDTSFTLITPGDPDGGITFVGTGFGAYTGNHPTTGTITEIHIRNGGAGGAYEADWTGLSLTVANFNSYVSTDNIAAFITSLFGGVDTLSGSTFGDHLLGYDGNDSIAPVLRLNPLDPGGSDIAEGGNGNDTIVASGMIAGDIFSGDAGTDTLGILGGPVGDNPDDDTFGWAVSDFASGTLHTFEAITFAGNGLNQWASFSSSEIGTGFSASTAVGVVAGAPTANLLFINMDTTSINLSSWTFSNWNSPTDWSAIDTPADLITGHYDTVAILGDNTANNITGSSQGDTINGDNDTETPGGADTIHGGGGNDILDGWQGADQMFGDAGDDSIWVYTGEEASGEVIDGGVNTDTLEVHGQVDFIGMTITSIEKLNMRPDENQDVPSPSQANFYANQLGAGLSATLAVSGSAIGDNIVISAVNSADAVNLSGWTFSTWNSATDTILIYGADGANTLTGSSVADQIGGGAGADTMFGGAGDDQFFGTPGGDGADEMHGGTGNDIYGVFDASDVVIESAGEGTDRIAAWVNYTLSANVENGQLYGTATTLTGNGTANGLVGNDLANTLDGGAGADAMSGGGGNDTYYIDSASDAVTEVSGEGTDTIRSTIGISTLTANVENLELLSVAITGGGNELANRITGNASNNTIDGKGGADTMLGGAGNDTYVVDNSGDVVTETASNGTDIIFSSVDITSLAQNVENLTLTGLVAITATGNSGNNTITGNTLNNTLNGGSGEDSMAGGFGNDTYVVNSSGDTVTEAASAGFDTIISSIDIATLTANVDNLTLTGTALTGGGNELANVIVGNSLGNTLTGGLGGDQLNGAGGADTMTGGDGDDSYLVENAGDVVTEASGQGMDTIYAFISISSLAANVEKLTLMPAGGAIDGTGNGLDNRLNGNDSANTLTGLGGADVINGLGGNDHIIGGAGLDNLTGGAGNDVFVYQATTDSGLTGATRDLINDFVHGQDTIDLSAIDAISGGSDNAFTLIGASAFSHVAGQLRFDLIDAAGTANDFTVIGFDVNGDAVADSQITLKGLFTLVASDFVL